MALGAAFSVGTSALRLRRVVEAVGLDVAQLRTWLRRRPRRETVEAISAALARDSAGGLSPIAEAVLEPDPRRRAALCNEALGEVAQGLGWGEMAPRAAVRVSLWMTLFGVALLVLRGEAQGAALLDVFALGGGAMAFVLVAGREASAVAAARRSEIDGWVAESIRAAGEEGEQPLQGRLGRAARTRLPKGDAPP